MTQPVLHLNNMDDFVAFTQSIQFDAFADAIYVAEGEITGSFNDAVIDSTSSLATLN